MVRASGIIFPYSSSPIAAEEDIVYYKTITHECKWVVGAHRIGSRHHNITYGTKWS